MSTLKELNLISVINNTNLNNIINKVDYQKILDLYKDLTKLKCNNCNKLLKTHDKCKYCNKLNCIVFRDIYYCFSYCLYCLKDKKFDLICEIKTNGLLYRHNLITGKYIATLPYYMANFRYENVNYEFVINCLKKNKCF